MNKMETGVFYPGYLAKKTAFAELLLENKLGISWLHSRVFLEGFEDPETESYFDRATIDAISNIRVVVECKHSSISGYCGHIVADVKNTETGESHQK